MPDQTPIPDPFDDDDDEPGYCEACCNTGEVDSVFDGSPMPCPYCHGDDLDD